VESRDLYFGREERTPSFSKVVGREWMSVKRKIMYLCRKRIDEYFMVISDDQNLEYPITTIWRDSDDDSTDDDFNNSEISIIKSIIPNSTFWTRLWNFLNMEL
jgi:hypothetical protein